MILVTDTETSGVDVFNDRIVTCFAGLMNDQGEFEREVHLLINPGIEIPQGAIDVHGITNEKVQAEGVEPLDALKHVRELLQWAIDRDTPIVAYNAPFDLTLINAELTRHGLQAIDFQSEAIVIDPLVIDKATDKYRKGSRKLVDTAAHFGLEVDESKAHGADYDCLLAGRLALRFIQRSGLTINQLNTRQRLWKAEQAASLQNYFRTKAPAEKRNPTIVIDGGFPTYVNTPQSKETV